MPKGHFCYETHSPYAKTLHYHLALPGILWLFSSV